VLAVKRATTVIPTVFAVASDPVGNALVASLARPGGNITGLSTGYFGQRQQLCFAARNERGSDGGPHARPWRRNPRSPELSCMV